MCGNRSSVYWSHFCTVYHYNVSDNCVALKIHVLPMYSARERSFVPSYIFRYRKSRQHREVKSFVFLPDQFASGRLMRARLCVQVSVCVKTSVTIGKAMQNEERKSDGLKWQSSTSEKGVSS